MKQRAIISRKKKIVVSGTKKAAVKHAGFRKGSVQQKQPHSECYKEGEKGRIVNARKGNSPPCHHRRRGSS